MFNQIINWAPRKKIYEHGEIISQYLKHHEMQKQFLLNKLKFQVYDKASFTHLHLIAK